MQEAPNSICFFEQRTLKMIAKLPDLTRGSPKALSSRLPEANSMSKKHFSYFSGLYLSNLLMLASQSFSSTHTIV